MPRLRPRLVRSTRIVAGGLAVAAIALAPLSPASLDAAVAAGSPERDAAPSADFTAGIASINHGLQRVRLVGTGPVGGSVAIAGAGVEPTWTEAVGDGSWRATVRVPRTGTVVTVRSEVTGQRIDLPVTIDIGYLEPTGKLDTDSFRRTTHAEIEPAKPGARWEFSVDGVAAQTMTVPDSGVLDVDFRDLGFGRHVFEGRQYYDGEHNGLWFGEQTIDPTPVVDTATASRETGTAELTGRAPVHATLVVTDADGPVLGADGEPLRVPLGDEPVWSVRFLLGDRTGAIPVTVGVLDGETPVGSATTDLHVVAPLTARATAVDDGTVELAGTGEDGGEVALEDETGHPITGTDGKALVARIGAGWELRVPRAVLPDDAVIARQRVRGVEQGSLRLVLPARPQRPSAGGGDVVDGGGRTVASHGAVAGRIRHGARGSLAWTGAELGGTALAAVTATALGVGGLWLVRTRARAGARGGAPVGVRAGAHRVRGNRRA